MAIIRKQDLTRHIAKLEERYAKLRDALLGSVPNDNVYEQYCNNAEQFRQEFTEIDILDLDYALKDFESATKILREVKKLQAPRTMPGR